MTPALEHLSDLSLGQMILATIVLPITLAIGTGIAGIITRLLARVAATPNPRPPRAPRASRARAPRLPDGDR